MPTCLPCTLYARKSTDREDMQILSIPGQLRELRRFAERAGFEVTAELTESCSAREPGRPVFGKLLTDVGRGRVHRILAWKLDRLARNPVDGGALIHALGKGLLREIVTPEGTYTGTGDSKFMLAVQFGAATKMTDDLSAGVRRGNRDVCEEGRIPGAPPLGYAKIRDRGGFRGAGKAVPDPERFPLVQRLWRDAASGTMTVSDAWRRAVASGLTTRDTPGHPSAPIRLSHVHGILRNPFYFGVIRHGGEVYRGEHEPVVSKADFDRVQLLFRRKDTPRPSRHEFVFRGILRCGDCGGGRLMVGEEHVTTAGNRRVYYRCGRRRPGYPKCPSPPVAEPQLLGAAEEALRRITVTPELSEWTLGWVDWWIENHRTEEEAEALARQRQIEAAEAKLKRLADLVVSGTLAESDYLARKEEAQLELAELRARGADPSAVNLAWKERVEEILRAGSSCLDAFASGQEESRRAALAQVYANVTVSGRLPRFSLRSEYLALADVPVVHASYPKRYANFPRPQDCAVPNRKAARRSRLLAAFRAWCTRLLEVRTGNLAEPHEHHLEPPRPFSTERGSASPYEDGRSAV